MFFCVCCISAIKIALKVKRTKHKLVCWYVPHNRLFFLLRAYDFLILAYIFKVTVVD